MFTDWLTTARGASAVITLAIATMMWMAPAIAAPEGGRVSDGEGRIEQAGHHTDIYQKSHFMATDWQSFNLSAHESAEAHQPSTNARLLIRVDGSAPTNIAGRYRSNGITILENRAGIQFSQGAIVNVGGLLATSAEIDQKSLSGQSWKMSGVGGAVVNKGRIMAGVGGAVLAAVRVENAGTIISEGGDISLGAGGAFAVHFLSDGVVGFEVSKSAGASLVNSGAIKARGGIVRLTAQDARDVRLNVVSVSGVVRATKLERRGGVIYLSGGDEGVAEVSGDVKASEKVQATGKYVVVKSDAKISAPEILVGGDFQGKGDVPTARQTLVEQDALLDAGRGGRVIVWSDEITWFYGNLRAENGFAEISGKEILGYVNFAGIQIGGGTLLLDPRDIIIGTTGRALIINFGEGQGCGSDLDACTTDYSFVASHINALSSGTTAIFQATRNIIVEAAINHSDLNLTLDAGNYITIRSNINVGAGTLKLIAGRRIAQYDNIRANLDVNPTLTAARIEMTAPIFQATFQPNVPNNNSANETLILSTNDLVLTATFNQRDTETSHIDFITNVTLADPADREQALYSWMFASGRDATIATQQNASIVASTALSLGGQASNVFLDSAQHIIILGALGGAVNLRMHAGIDIRIGADIAIGPRTLILSAGRTNVNLTNIYAWPAGSTPTLTAQDINITQPIFQSAFRRNNSASQNGDDITLNPSGNLTLIATGGNFFGESSRVPGAIIADTSLQPIYPYMIASGRDLILTAPNILVSRSINVGTGTISLSAPTGKISFLNDSSPTTEIRLDGSRIILVAGAAPDPSNKILRIIASGDVELGTNVNTTGNLRIVAGNGSGSGKLLLSNHDIILDGAGMDLRSDTAVSGSDIQDFDLTVRSSENLSMSAYINTGQGDIILEAGFGIGNNRQLNLGNAAGYLATLIGRNITLTGIINPTDAVLDVVLTAQVDSAGNGGALNLNTNISGDTQAVTLTAEVINFSTSRNSQIRAGILTLMSNQAPVASNRTLTISTISAIIGASLDTGTGNLVVTATGGAISFLNGPIELKGRNVTLTSDRPPPSSSDLPLTITALENVTINASINQGTSNLIISAGRGATSTGVISFGSNATNITAGSIVLTQNGAAFPATVYSGVSFSTPPVIIYDGVEAQPTGDWFQTVESYPARANGDHEVSRANIFSRGLVDIRASGGTLTFAGTGPITIDAVGNILIRANNVDFGGRPVFIRSNGGTVSIEGNLTNTGAGANILLRAQSGVSFTRDRVVRAWDILIYDAITGGVGSGSGGLTFMAENNILIAGHVSLPTAAVGGNDLVFNAAGAINFARQLVEITAHDITLTAANAPTASNFGLTVNARGDLFINTNINAGTQNISLTAGSGATTGAINFSTEKTVEIRGGSITLISDTASPASNRDLTVIASANLLVAADLDTGTGRLSLTAGSGTNVGQLSFRSDGATNLTGGSIDLFSPQAGTASDQNLTITSTAGDIRVEASLNSGTGLLEINAAGAINFANQLVELTAHDITLTAANAPTASNFGLIVRASGDLFINTDINTGTQNINLSAGVGATTGAINFSTQKTVEIRGGTINLVSDTASPASNRDLTVIARLNLLIDADLDTGTGKLSLTAGSTGAGRFIFSLTAATSLTGGSIDLFAPGEGVANNQDVTITSTAGDIRVEASLNTGIGRLEINSAGAILFSSARAVTLITTGAGDLVLIAANAPALASSQSITLNAGNNLELATDINGGDLTLSAGGSLNLSASKAVELTGGEITITADEISDASNQDLTITARDNLNIGINFRTGTQNLSLTAGAGGGTGAINFSTSKSIVLTGNVITLTASAAPAESNQDLTITALSNLNINADINAGTGTLTFEAGNSATAVGIIIFDVPTRSITSDSIFLSQDGAVFPPDLADRPAVFSTLPEVYYFGSLDQQLAGDWYILAANQVIPDVIDLGGAGDFEVSGRTLTARVSITLTATGGTITFAGTGPITLTAPTITLNADNVDFGRHTFIITANGGVLTINTNMTGTGDLTLNATQIDFTGARTINGGVVSLLSSSRISAIDGLNIEAAGLLSIGNSVNAGENNLILTSNTGAINFSSARAVVLNGDDITLTAAAAPTASDQNLTITALGDLNVNADINTGTGALALSAGRSTTDTGVITFDNTNREITAAVITLTQDGAFFQLTPSPATFSVVPFVIYDGPPDASGDSQPQGDWFVFVILPERINEGGVGDLLVSSAELIATQSITLTATGGTITFPGTGPITLTAPDITINADNVDFGGRTFIITADGGTLTINTDMTGSGNLTLNATQMDFTGIRVINGGSVSLLSDNEIVGTGALTIIASGTLFIGNSVNTGDQDLTLTAGTGALDFTSARAVVLTGHNITLEGEGSPTESNQDLTIYAAGDVDINTDIDIGSGILNIAAGRTDIVPVVRTHGTGTGVINFDDNVERSIRASAIRLVQNGAFFQLTPSPAAFSTFPVIVYDGAGDQQQGVWFTFETPPPPPAPPSIDDVNEADFSIYSVSDICGSDVSQAEQGQCLDSEFFRKAVERGFCFRDFCVVQESALATAQASASLCGGADEGLAHKSALGGTYYRGSCQTSLPQSGGAKFQRASRRGKKVPIVQANIPAY